MLMHSNYSMYTDWCIAETLAPDGQNHFLEIDPDFMMTCVNTSVLESTIITRAELERVVDTLPNYTDKFMFYAIFEGISGEFYREITAARLCDIDMEMKRIKLCTGREIPISDKLIDVATWAANEESYVAYGTGRIYPYRKDDPDDLLFKITGFKQKVEERDIINTSQVMIRRYVKGLAFMGLPRQLTTKRLAVSGKIDYIRKLMKEENLSAEECIRLHREEIDSRYPVERLKSTPIFLKKYEKALNREEQ